jgi:hypothetical protein
MSPENVNMLAILERPPKSNLGIGRQCRSLLLTRVHKWLPVQGDRGVSNETQCDVICCKRAHYGIAVCS